MKAAQSKWKKSLIVLYYYSLTERHIVWLESYSFHIIITKRTPQITHQHLHHSRYNTNLHRIHMVLLIATITSFYAPRVWLWLLIDSFVPHTAKLHHSTPVYSFIFFLCFPFPNLALFLLFIFSFLNIVASFSDIALIVWCIVHVVSSIMYIVTSDYQFVKRCRLHIFFFLLFWLILSLLLSVLLLPHTLLNSDLNFL